MEMAMGLITMATTRVIVEMLARVKALATIQVIIRTMVVVIPTTATILAMEQLQEMVITPTIDKTKLIGNTIAIIV